MIRGAVFVTAAALGILTTPGDAFAQAPGDVTAAPPAPSREQAPTPAVAPPTQPTEDASAMGAMEARLRRLESELEAVKRAQAETAPAPPPSPSPAPAASVTPGVAGITMTLSGLLQTDLVLVRQSSQEEISPATGDALNEKRFVLRRARLAMHAEKAFLSATFMLDGNTVKAPAFRVIEGWLGATWTNPNFATETGHAERKTVPYLMATVGLMRIPFGTEVIEPDRERSFLERSTAARAMFGNAFDLGARLHGGYRFLRYSVAAMNGAPLGESQFQGRDPNENRDLLARVGVDTDVAPRVRFQAGVSGVTGKGFHAGSLPTKDVLTWRDDNENGIVETTELHVTTGAPATPSSSFRRFLVGADARVIVGIPHVGDSTLSAEIYRGKNMDRALVVSDPVALGRDQRQTGVGVSVTQGITPYALVGARYDRYNPDADATDARGAKLVPLDRTFSTLTFAVAALYAPGRLIAQYDILRNALGRATDGSAATLKDDTFTLRAELAF